MCWSKVVMMTYREAWGLGHTLCPLVQKISVGHIHFSPKLIRQFNVVYPCQSLTLIGQFSVVYSYWSLTFPNRKEQWGNVHHQHCYVVCGIMYIGLGILCSPPKGFFWEWTALTFKHNGVRTLFLIKLH